MRRTSVGRQRIEQRDLIDGVFDDDARRVQLGAGIGLLLDDGHAQARGRERVRAREPAEARADDDAVGVDLRFARVHRASVTAIAFAVQRLNYSRG